MNHIMQLYRAFDNNLLDYKYFNKTKQTKGQTLMELFTATEKL
jgi:hypothetical protein